MQDNEAAEQASKVATASSSASHEDDITAAVEGAAGIITLNRPRTLNALTAAMRARISAAMAAWSHDPQVYAAVIESGTDRAFCAGGDVREMADCGRRDLDEARRMLAAEYALNWQLDCFAKPSVALIDGAVMGGGVGISLFATHKVAGERYRFAMPETGIGLFPDDGVCWALARLPDEVGIYLALTGRPVGAADAYRLGLVTHCLPAAQFAEVRAAVVDADPVDQVLDARHVDPGAGEIDALRPAIARCFNGNSVEDIIGRLEGERGEARAWAESVLVDLARCAPVSLKVTLRHVRQARNYDLSATLIENHRLACRFMEARDFYEGVRAVLIDRDRAPKWQPGKLADVDEALLDAYFAPLGAGELQLTTRAEMQAVR